MSNLTGKRDLSSVFVVFLFGWGVFFGEILPVWTQPVPAGASGAKESMFASTEMLIPTVVVYTVLATLFWWLFRRVHWLIVLFAAILLGIGMEFLLFRPEETAGPNVTDDPLAALVFFIVVWPLLLVLPFCVYAKCDRLLRVRVRSRRSVSGAGTAEEAQRAVPGGRSTDSASR